MSAALVMDNSSDVMGIRWSPMMALSVVFHLVVFIVIILVPESIPTRSFKGVVYEVNLVEMPRGRDLHNRGAGLGTGKGKKGKGIAKKGAETRRIQTQEPKKKPLVIAKRTLNKKRTSTRKPKISSSQLIDRAISRIEKKVKSEDGGHVEKAISRLQKKVGQGSGSGSLGGGAITGLPFRIYQMEVEGWIKGHWAYPVAVDSQKSLEAIVVVKAKRDGTILKSWFQKRSNNAIFDQSVLKAIEKSNPLPPFPEGYRKSSDEFEINFNLKDLEGP